jgi:trans-aconitate 2-methyltransferase
MPNIGRDPNAAGEFAEEFGGPMSATLPDWDPEQYLRFADERLRPAIDLAARIVHPHPKRVVDLGCGTGSALALLSARFPGVELVGVDSSPVMLDKARSAGAKTVLADIAKWSPPKPVDVIFSNAALHWIADHAALFPKLLACLTPGGILAVQMPAMYNEPVRTLQAAAAASGPWSAQLAGVASAPPILEPEAYYDLLSARAASIEIWITRYLHVLRGEDPVVQWAMGTSLRPYLDALSPSDRPGFLAAYSALLQPHYPRRADGSVLLPFRRLFLLLKKK